MPWLLMAVVALMGAGAPEVTCAESVNGAGTVIAVSGPVTVTPFAMAPQPLKFGDALYWGDVVETRKDGFARLWLGGSTTVTVKELSRLELQKEPRADGMRYTLELVWGKLRVSVARMLMRQGEHVEVRTRNAVASVRGTDFIVETAEHPAQKRAFGLLGASEVAQAVGNSGSASEETVVSTLAGLVEVSNRLSGTGGVERIGASETSRVIRTQGPLKVRTRAEDLRSFFQGSTRP